VDGGALTVFDVALAGSAEAHAALVRDWAGSVWSAWAEHHAAVADFLSQHLAMRRDER
jgi:hypothetical protein